MAKANVSTSQKAEFADLREANGNVVMSENRRLLALEASWEIASLAELLPSTVSLPDPDRAIRGIAFRLTDLSNAITRLISDVAHSTEDLSYKVKRESSESLLGSAS